MARGRMRAANSLTVVVFGDVLLLLLLLLLLCSYSFSAVVVGTLNSVCSSEGLLSGG